MNYPQLINFYPYQQRFLDDESRFVMAMFSRQVGKTFTACAKILRKCLQAEVAGQRTRWVILSRGERQAAEAMDEAIKPLSKAFYILYQNLLKNKKGPEFFTDTFRTPNGVSYKALEVAFPGGSRITALPANPDTARGYSANTLLDEFAFHADSRKIWAALFPVISKSGLQLIITSTPNGKKNKFYDLWTTPTDVWSRHRTDIYEAVADGLDRDIDALRAALADEEAWAQEFELQFLEDALSWISFDLITANEHPAAGKPELYTGGPCIIGNDIAKRRHLWVAWVWEIIGDVLWTREIKVLEKATFAEQDAVLDELVKRYHVIRVAMDQTGMGEKPVEDAQRRYGSGRVEGILMAGSRPFNIATSAKQAFEERRLRIPSDPKIRADFQQIKKITGPTGHPRLLTEETKDGHADRAWAAWMGIAAADTPIPDTTILSGAPRQSAQLFAGYM